MSAAAARNAPSVSPLSTASKPRSSPPPATRSANVRGTGAQNESVHTDDGARELEAEDRDLSDAGSSSLSEPEDDDEEDGLQDDADVRSNDGHPSPALASLEVDSEAETERLEQTPRKQRQLPTILGRTPSKLSQTAAVDDDLSDPPSPLPVDPGAASSTSTVLAGGKKRKRSDSGDSSLTSADSNLGESPVKRTHGSAADPTLDADEANGESDLPVDGTGDIAETPIPDENAATITGRARGRKVKKKGFRKAKTSVEEVEVETADTPVDIDDEQSEEMAARTEEELKRRLEATNAFEDVAKQFRAFRERLTTERLASLDAELALLSQPNCEHPEFLRQVACVDARLHKQRMEAHAFYSYRLRSLRERTLAERSQLHSQYFQHIRQLREDVLDDIGQDWYGIQKERRQSHQDPDDAYIYKLPEKKSLQIRQQAKYNQEVSLLSGIAKHVGFPAAPEVAGVQGSELERDLEAMKLRKQATQQTRPTSTVYPAKSAASHALGQSEKLAHDQFIEQTAWARPQGPVTNHGNLGISHTPDWAEPSITHSSKTAVRNLSSQHHNRQSSPFATPVTHRRALAEVSSSGTVAALHSDGPEMPSSVLAAPPTADRMAVHVHRSEHQTSPIAMPKTRPNGIGTYNTTTTSDFPTFRNVSGLSGTSTIDASTSEFVDSEGRRPPNGHNGGGASGGLFSNFPTDPRAHVSSYETNRLPALNSSTGGSEEGKRDLYAPHSSAAVAAAAAAASFRPHDPANFAPSAGNSAVGARLPSASTTGA